jgi:hypothetical protein
MPVKPLSNMGLAVHNDYSKLAPYLAVFNGREKETLYTG